MRNERTFLERLDVPGGDPEMLKVFADIFGIAAKTFINIF